ncbi:MAG: PorV/PorQ family protein [Bacteroidetes bacterium]|nr:PorV/PorQ family protein [Bacteroidota bacterium]
MKNFYSIVACLLILSAPVVVNAGNPDRTGQAGASELLINPFARSSGFNSLNTASVKGIESIRMNIGGLAHTQQTEIIFSNTNWLRGSDIFINTFGLSQKVGDAGALGVSIMAMSFGDIEITTGDLPEGGIGTYKPQFLNIALGYSKAFSSSIYGGFVARAIHESIPDVNAQGLAIDAGIQYITGSDENLRFGISLRNIGMPMKFGGDGISFSSFSPSGDFDMTVEQRSQRYELPSLLNIGGAYDLKFQDKHRVTIVANFTSNSFTPDQVGAGIEYSFKEYFMVRAGYKYEEGITKSETRNSALTGLGAGFTVELPMKTDGPTFGLDYSYRTTNPFNGIHSLGVRINL